MISAKVASFVVTEERHNARAVLILLSSNQAHVLCDLKVSTPL